MSGGIWWVTLATVGCLGGESGSGPWRLGRELNLPDWLEVSGEQRTRLETLDGQYRAGFAGGDQALAMRTSLLVQGKAESGRLVAELLDARHYLSDAGSPMDTTWVNALDVLQAHVRWDVGELMTGGTNTVRLGRQTLDLGNRRLLARNAYRNTINSFTGLDWLWQGAGGGTVRVFYFLPVQRLPDDVDSLLDNDIRADTQSFDQQLWGVYAEAPRMRWGFRAEGYYFRMLEEADPGSRHRHLHTPGLRVYRAAKAGDWDFEVETTVQWGGSRSRAGGADLDHFAHFQHAQVGYTWAAPMQPRAMLVYDHATGDSDPTDGKNGRFDTLFGARRFEYGPTGLYGLVARANVSSPGYVLGLKPWRGGEINLSHRILWLAEARDSWGLSGLRDATGGSGTSFGQQVELRVRWEMLPGNLRWDAGLVQVFAGDYLRNVPNSTGEGDVRFGYVEVTLVF